MDSVNAGAVRKGPIGRRPAFAAVVALSLASGCTMCPDPFDYAGPVPDGAVTQNDFAARSNGILPVRATPLPWPPIVDSAPRRPTPAADVEAAESAVVATVPLDAAEDDPETVSVLEASLTAPAEADGGPQDAGGPVVDSSHGDAGAVVGADDPARALRPVPSRRMTATPSADPGSEDAEADAEPGDRGRETILESRLPKDSPRILLR